MGSEHDHPRIWLSPGLPAGVFDDRAWCQNNVWADLPECQDDPPTEYVRADLVAEKDAEIARLRAVLLERGVAP